MLWILIFIVHASANHVFYNSTEGEILIVNDVGRTYNGSESFCKSLSWRLGGVPGVLPYVRANDPGLRSRLNQSLEYWVAVPSNQNGICTTIGYSSNVGNLPSYKRPCNDTHMFLCAGTTSMTPTTSTLTPNSSTSGNISAIPHSTTNKTILYVNFQHMTYQDAARFCQRNVNGSLASSSTVLGVGPGLGNKLQGKLTFWLQGKSKGQCTILYNDGNASTWNISSDKCDSQLPFICKDHNVTSPTSASFTPSTTSMTQAKKGTPVTPSSGTTLTTNWTSIAPRSGQTGWHVIGESEYRLSSGGCTYTSADRCCQAVGGHLSPTLDSPTLKKILKILPKFGYDGKIWINGTSCILGHSALQPYCDILTIVNGVPVYNKTNVTDVHFCLCRRPDTPDHDKLPCTEFNPTWKRAGNVEFWKSGRPRTHKKAKEQCKTEGAELVDPSMVQDLNILNVLELAKSDGIFWIKTEHASSTCSAFDVEHNKHLRLVNKTCSSSLYSICERPISVSATIPTSISPTSVATSTSTQSSATTLMEDRNKTQQYRNTRHEFHISYDEVTNNEAETNCRDKHNSSLTFFTMATAYFQMAEELSLAIGEYWVGVGITPPSNNSCLLLYIQDRSPSSLVATDCATSHHSICRKPVKNENKTMTFEPEFLEMLQEMTVTRKTTHAQRRRFSSATDYRTSSKAIGLLGMIVVLCVSLIIVGFDISNLKGCPKRRRRTMSSSTA